MIPWCEACMKNLLQNAAGKAAEGLAAGCGTASLSSTKKQLIVAAILFLLAVNVVLLQQVPWTDWVKQQVALDVLEGSVADPDVYSPRVDRNKWYRLKVPDGTGDWKERLWKKASFEWCNKLSCPNSRFMQEPAVSGWWLANATVQCPDYFKWIREDLAPWSATGVTLENVLAARSFGHMRVTIVKGKLYAEYYEETFETRGPFTLWGLALLLERYPGLVPDVDFVFQMGDWPPILKSAFPDSGAAPVVFSYCNTANHYNVAFPDWSFWGWPEVRVFPWERQGAEIFQAAEKNRWEDRKNITFWRGNPNVGNIRRALLDCDVSKRPKSTVQADEIDWWEERANGFQSSDLASHCEYKYMIYAEGNAWSVGYKYTMACGAPMLAIESPFYEFFTRSLHPNVHYLPVGRDHLCDSIDAQVDWANSHRDEAKAVAKILPQPLLPISSSIRYFEPIPLVPVNSGAVNIWIGHAALQHIQSNLLLHPVCPWNLLLHRKATLLEKEIIRRLPGRIQMQLESGT